MWLKDRPCAYCGTTEVPREKGHVIPRCLYSAKSDPTVQRITVPECQQCKTIWQDAEAHFRNILAVAGEPNELVHELWSGAITRSFTKPSGHRWLNDLRSKMVPVDTKEGPRFKVYPGNDPHVNLVIRKIVRGLCHHEGILTAISDERVWADVLRYRIPEMYLRQMTWKLQEAKFFEFGYSVLNDREFGIHSVWSLKFFERREFISVISLTDSGWPIESQR